MRSGTSREELEKMLTVGVHRRTGVVSVSVETRYAPLSADVANYLVHLLNEFNLQSRQSNARALRRFMADRVSGAQSELRAAEDTLRAFMQQNRQFQDSPELQFEHDRLQRRVQVKEEVLRDLNRNYEEARIQEVNDTPLLTVIDQAVAPQKKSRPKYRVNVLLAQYRRSDLRRLWRTVPPARREERRRRFPEARVSLEEVQAPPGTPTSFLAARLAGLTRSRVP